MQQNSQNYPENGSTFSNFANLTQSNQQQQIPFVPTPPFLEIFLHFKCHRRHYFRCLTTEIELKEKFKTKFNHLSNEFQAKEKDHAKKIKKLSDQYQYEIEQLKSQLEQLKDSNQPLNRIVEQRNQNDQNIYNQYQAVKRLKSEIETKNQGIQQLQSELDISQNDQNLEEKEFKDEILGLKKELKNSQTMFQQKENELKSFTDQKTQEINLLQSKLNESEHKEKVLQIENVNYKNINELLTKHLDEKQQEISSMKEFANQGDQRINLILKKNQQNDQRLNEDLNRLDNLRNQGLQKHEEMKKKKIESQKTLNVQGIEMKKYLIQKLDKVQCCILADIQIKTIHYYLDLITVQKAIQQKESKKE